ncbi:cytochrome P450 [Corallococcus praedator]|uniref:Cytochrome P450 n=1 Tax=Corallococcus praedator TaxID=2316724 RepID=A0ABX9QM48_9BACT|nr:MULTISPECIES: cytochrome P450 [Corallococcus]RKH19369.1 cytochrome P450 [Corallococcus sp. CA047B]RKH33296.1 cytochrome P450 [Corallococcus sp. CA031C]RKI12277.1 cytochrome P450 [Corallococcus praedator]
MTTATAARIPTGPRGHLLMGVLPQVRRDILGFLSDIHREYGDVVRYRLGPLKSHLIAHPDGVRHVLQDHVKNYTKDHLSYRMGAWITGNGLLTSQGDFWLRQRRLAQPAFHRQRIAGMATQMIHSTEAMLQRWEASAAQGTPVGVTEEMMRLSLGIVGEALFGTSVEDQTARVGAAFNELSRQIAERFRSFNMLPPVLPTRNDRAFRAARTTLRETVQGIIATRRQRPEDTGDLLSMLMAARDEDTGTGMTDAQLGDEVLTMLLAGHETTATTLSWVFGLLATHPEVEARLHAEVDAVLAGRVPTVEDVPKLGYTRQVVEEAMRLYPAAVIFSRTVVEDDVIGGFKIPKGSAVDVSPYVTHRHPDFWEEPNAFRPERFAPEAAARRHRFAWFPFSGGPRQCIGNSFAMMESQLVLATVAQRYRLREAPGFSLQPESHLSLRPYGGLPMHLERRSPVARS